MPYDGDSEGHGGAQNPLPAWLSATNPDVAMHLGTNDVWSNRSTSAILDAYRTLVCQMRANNPAMPGWAAAMSTARSPITVGDQKISDRWYPAVAAAVST